mmetsp:Transcript_88441/g.233123  ORF Transcript_88441/g.233123 Transcript_88441/m.233123 type:complete len:261 (+) Transcript_88441:2-784(+)
MKLLILTAAAAPLAEAAPGDAFLAAPGAAASALAQQLRAPSSPEEALVARSAAGSPSVAVALGATAAAAAGSALLRRGRKTHKARTTRVGSMTPIPAMPKLRPVFDPLDLCSDKDAYAVARSTESILGRVAMLAAVGLPLSEIYHEGLAEQAGLPSKLVDGRAPMALNGGDFGAIAEFAMIAAIAGLSVASQMKGETKDSDPLNPRTLSTPTLSPMLKTMMGLVERLNGRIAMVAVVLMMAQEQITGVSVVDSAPYVFGL